MGRRLHFFQHAPTAGAFFAGRLGKACAGALDVRDGVKPFKAAAGLHGGSRCDGDLGQIDGSEEKAVTVKMRDRELLLRSGFRYVDTFFKWYNFCGMVAVK